MKSLALLKENQKDNLMVIEEHHEENENTNEGQFYNNSGHKV